MKFWSKVLLLFRDLDAVLKETVAKGFHYYQEGEKDLAYKTWQEARQIAQEKGVFDLRHADILTNLALLCFEKPSYGEAELLLKKCIAMIVASCGPDHPQVATNLNYLASLYYHLGDSCEAEPLFKHALVIREQVLGEDHLDLAASLLNLADLYDRDLDFQHSEPLKHRAASIYKKARSNSKHSV